MNASAQTHAMPDPPETETPRRSLSPAGFVARLLAAMAATAITIGFCLKAANLNTISEPGVVMTLPDRIGDFTGRKEVMSESEKRILPGDTEILRKRYTNSFGDQITCSIVLSGGEKRSIHRPEICLPSQGWILGTGGKVAVPLASGRTLEVTDLNLSRQAEIQPGVFRPIRSQFLYWFVGKDITTSDHMVRILRTSWDRVYHKINHRWAYVLVTSLVGDSLREGGMTDEQTQKMLEKFIRDIVPFFQKSEMPPETPGS
ncbi:MAG: exosortase C-terminal domain/associated protein EpsI [Verrucomicrobiota bacterium]